ncbi:hypothetical protein Nmel_007150, partial [Mimus melanotis]
RWGLGGAGAVVAGGLPGPGAAVPPPEEQQEEEEAQSGSAGGRRARVCAWGATLAGATQAGSGSAGPEDCAKDFYSDDITFGLLMQPTHPTRHNVFLDNLKSLLVFLVAYNASEVLGHA